MTLFKQSKPASINFRQKLANAFINQDETTVKKLITLYTPTQVSLWLGEALADTTKRLKHIELEYGLLKREFDNACEELQWALNDSRELTRFRNALETTSTARLQLEDKLAKVKTHRDEILAVNERLGDENRKLKKQIKQLEEQL